VPEILKYFEEERQKTLLILAKFQGKIRFPNVGVNELTGMGGLPAGGGLSGG